MVVRVRVGVAGRVTLIPKSSGGQGIETSSTQTTTLRRALKDKGRGKVKGRDRVKLRDSDSHGRRRTSRLWGIDLHCVCGCAACIAH